MTITTDYKSIVVSSKDLLLLTEKAINAEIDFLRKQFDSRPKSSSTDYIMYQRKTERAIVSLGSVIYGLQDISKHIRSHSDVRILDDQPNREL